MAKTDKVPKVYNKKNPGQPQESIDPDDHVEKSTFPAKTTPNEKLSIPERKLNKDKKSRIRNGMVL